MNMVLLQFSTRLRRYTKKASIVFSFSVTRFFVVGVVACREEDLLSFVDVRYVTFHFGKKQSILMDTLWFLDYAKALHSINVHLLGVKLGAHRVSSNTLAFFFKWTIADGSS